MTILTGYVPTPVGEAALEAAIEEAKLRGAPLTVVNSTSGDRESEKKVADDATATKIRSRLDESGVTYRLLRSISSREPAQELIDMAADDDIELLVIGLRRRTPVGKLLLGSTAQRVLLEATCPVLAVKPTQ